MRSPRHAGRKRPVVWCAQLTNSTTYLQHACIRHASRGGKAAHTTCAPKHETAHAPSSDGRTFVHLRAISSVALEVAALRAAPARLRTSAPSRELLGVHDQRRRRRRHGNIRRRRRNILVRRRRRNILVAIPGSSRTATIPAGLFTGGRAAGFLRAAGFQQRAVRACGKVVGAEGLDHMAVPLHMGAPRLCTAPSTVSIRSLRQLLSEW